MPPAADPELITQELPLIEPPTAVIPVQQSPVRHNDRLKSKSVSYLTGIPVKDVGIKALVIGDSFKVRENKGVVDKSTETQGRMVPPVEPQPPIPLLRLGIDSLISSFP